jgi:hypothetical protein
VCTDVDPVNPVSTAPHLLCLAIIYHLTPPSSSDSTACCGPPRLACTRRCCAS